LRCVSARSCLMRPASPSTRTRFRSSPLAIPGQRHPAGHAGSDHAGHKGDGDGGHRGHEFGSAARHQEYRRRAQGSCARAWTDSEISAAVLKLGNRGIGKPKRVKQSIKPGEAALEFNFQINARISDGPWNRQSLRLPIQACRSALISCWDRPTFEAKHRLEPEYRKA